MGNFDPRAYLVGHLDQLRRCAHGGSRDDATILLDIGGLNYHDVDVLVRPVFCVISLLLYQYFSAKFGEPWETSMTYVN